MFNVQNVSYVIFHMLVDVFASVGVPESCHQSMSKYGTSAKCPQSLNSVSGPKGS